MDTRAQGDVLVVDDTPENITFLAAMLKDAGYRVRAATGGAQALEAVELEPPEIVLLDIDMPGMDGYEVCRRLKARPSTAGIPVVFLSALGDTWDKVRAFAVGGVDYVTKPFKVEEVDARLATHLATRRLQLELERRNAEVRGSHARLRELERARQALVQMIVHDLKSPLAALSSNAKVLRRALSLEGDLDGALDDVVELAAIMERMVLDVLDVTRAGETRLAPRLEPVALRPFLAGIVDRAQGPARASGKRIALTVSDDAPAEVQADPDHLRRLLENLLDNAFKYAPSGSLIAVEAAAAAPERYALRVRDGGPGIPPAARQAIFEPYARLGRDGVGPHARASRGLGLAFCRLAARAHGGEVEARDAEGGGSVFEVRLAVSPEAPALPRRARVEAAP